MYEIRGAHFEKKNPGIPELFKKFYMKRNIGTTLLKGRNYVKLKG